MPPPQPHPAKSIPPSRDRLQSRWLVAAVTLYLIPRLVDVLGSGWIAFEANHLHFAFTYPLGWYNIEALCISVAFAGLAWILKAATPTAAICGGLTCLQLTDPHTAYVSHFALWHSPIPALLLLFVLTFAATRLGRARNEVRGIAESRSGRRASQVIANLGVAALCVAFSQRVKFPIVFIPMLAALCEATADTVSSEIGQAFGGTPILLTTLRRVPPGTDGAISLNGTLAGIAAAAIVAASAMPALGMSLTELAIALGAGVAGLFFDSLLGATLERRGFINNDLVNFASTAFAAALTLPTLRLLKLTTGY